MLCTIVGLIFNIGIILCAYFLVRDIRNIGRSRNSRGSNHYRSYGHLYKYRTLIIVSTIIVGIIFAMLTSVLTVFKFICCYVILATILYFIMNPESFSKIFSKINKKICGR